jgi:hypothetical protein
MSYFFAVVFGRLHKVNFKNPYIMNKKVFGVLIMLLATAFTLISCDDKDMEEDFLRVQSVSEKPAEGDYVVSTEYRGDREVTSENSELCSVYKIDVYNSGKESEELIATQPLYRGITTSDLGTHKVTNFGAWSASNGKLSEGETSSKSGYTGFTLQSRTDVYGAKLSNGTLNLNSKYELYHEGCTFTNSDTTIVFAILDYAVEEVSTTCDGEGNLTNTIKTTYSEYVQNASETGKLYVEAIPEEPEQEPEEEEDGRKFVKAAFSATINPSQKNDWLYSAAVQFEDGTLALPISQDGTPMWSQATWWAGVKDNSLNGAFYVAKSSKWYPCIASDQNGHMEWSLCAAQGSYALGMLDFAGADTYGDWNSNDKNHGQHTVLTNRFQVKNDAKKHTLTFSYNGVVKGTYSYASF